MKNIKKIYISAAMITAMLFGNGSYAMQPVQPNKDQRPTRKEKCIDGITTAVIAPTVFGGAAWMFKKYMNSMDSAQLATFFGKQVLALKTTSALALTTSLIAGAAGLYGIKQALTPGGRVAGAKNRCIKIAKNAGLVAASSLATIVSYKGLAISASATIKKAVDSAYNVKAFSSVIACGMVATGAYLGYRGLRSVWEAYKGIGCAYRGAPKRSLSSMPRSSIVNLEEGLARVEAQRRLA